MLTNKSLSLLTLIFRSINLNEKVIKTSIIVLIQDQNGSIQRMIASGRDLGRPSKMGWLSGTEGASCCAPGAAVNLSGKCTIVGRNSGECAICATQGVYDQAAWICKVDHL